MVLGEGSFPEWPDDDEDFPADQKLPWAHEVLRQNFVDPEPDVTESAEEFHERLIAEVADRGWRVSSLKPEGGAYAAVVRREDELSDNRELTGFGRSVDEALMIALANVIAYQNE